MMKKVFIQVTSDDLKDTAAIRRAASEGRLFVEEQEASDNREVTAAAVASAKPSAVRPAADRMQHRRREVRLTPTRLTFRMACADGMLPMMAQRFYVGLTALGLLDERTDVGDVVSLLSGESDCRLRWTGGAESLAYVAKRLLLHPAVSLPAGAKIWMVVRSHFVRADGKLFGNELGHQHTPQRLKEAIDLLVDSLDPAIGRDEFIHRLNG